MVSINLVINNGIIGKSKNAVDRYSDEEVQEMIKTGYSEYQMAKYKEPISLKVALNNSGLAVEDKDIVGDDTNGWTITYKGKSYPLSARGEVGTATAVVDWDTVIANAQKHPDQDPNITDIGIDMYGNPVNLDYWDYECDNNNHSFVLGKTMGSKRGPGYKGNIINGKIEGEIPQYIKIDDNLYSLLSLTSAFQGNNQLVISPNIPDTVTNMVYTFSNCTLLTTIGNIGKSVTNMDGAFANCTSLTAAPEIPNSVTNMTSTFAGCTSLKTAPTIPNSVTNMGSTFADCTSLTAAPEIPNSVTNMSDTFDDCILLTAAPTIPNSVTNMSGTFRGCIELIQVPTIPNSVTNMFATFSSCTSLKTAPTIPNLVTNIESTFNGCTSLTGDLVINANNVYSYQRCFLNTATNGGCNLVVSGTCPQLDAIIATKSSNSHITKGN